MTLETLMLAVGSETADRTEALTNTTLDVAKAADATTVFLHVFSEKGFDDAVKRLDFGRDDAPEPDRVAARLQRIDNITDTFDAEGLEYEVRGVVGEQGESIVAVAEDVSADMLFVGGKKRSPTGKAVFGSTAQEVMLNGPCPVTYVRGDIGSES